MTREEFADTYMKTLSSQQREAVEAVDGPVLLLAVPGSGKTTVLVIRLGYMILCRQIDPKNILTLTYTVAATRDMASRFERYFGQELAGQVEFRTINGICARIIQYFGRAVGKTPFALAAEEKDQMRGLLTDVFRQVQQGFPTEYDLKQIRTQITYIKNMMLSEEERAAYAQKSDYRIEELFREYNRRLRQMGLMDYDDQMTYALAILRKSPETLRYFQQQYKYVCVDEAQDTSRIQHAIISLLAADNANLFMVGDEDQSIYGFRAAYPQALLDFGKDHPGARILLMEQNYRSAGQIVRSAQYFILQNRLRHKKNMSPTRPDGKEIRWISLKGRAAQYTYLAKAAADCRSETAVLYRDNESMLPLADLLERQGTPYRLRAGDITFFSHRTVLDIENIIRFALDPFDTELFLQIYYKVGTYLTKANAQEACRISAERRIPVLDAALWNLKLSMGSVKACKALRTHLEDLRTDAAGEAVYRIIHYMGYKDYLARAGISDGRLFILQAIAAREKRPVDFLERMAALEEIIRSKENDPACPFVLSTIHSSKGLEYDTVYLMDVADGIFPEAVPKNVKRMRKEERAAYEEERRLFYVGMTRARNLLCIFRLPQGSVFARELGTQES